MNSGRGDGNLSAWDGHFCPLAVARGYALGVSQPLLFPPTWFEEEVTEVYAERFAVTEASYVLIRFLQTLESIQCMDPRPWQEKVSLTFSSLNGVRVAFKRGW